MICERCGEPIAARDRAQGERRVEVEEDAITQAIHNAAMISSTAIEFYDLPYHRSIDICFVALAKAGRLFVAPK